MTKASQIYRVFETPFCLLACLRIKKTKSVKKMDIFGFLILFPFLRRVSKLLILF
jgi:hypothetical protein